MTDVQHLYLVARRDFITFPRRCRAGIAIVAPLDRKVEGAARRIKRKARDAAVSVVGVAQRGAAANELDALHFERCQFRQPEGAVVVGVRAAERAAQVILAGIAVAVGEVRKAERRCERVRLLLGLRRASGAGGAKGRQDGFYVHTCLSTVG